MGEESLQSLAERLQSMCLAAGFTVAAAESCTGGLVASSITDVSGSSGYFRGGMVVYANQAKIALLGVSEAILEQHGAVSAQVARAMADGARERLGCDLAVSVTGVAGPGGGTPSKPVGLTYVAVADRQGVSVQRYVWPGDRSANKRASAAAALRLLIERAAALNEGAASGAGGSASGPDRSASGTDGSASGAGEQSGGAGERRGGSGR